MKEKLDQIRARMKALHEQSQSVITAAGDAGLTEADTAKLEGITKEFDALKRTEAAVIAANSSAEFMAQLPPDEARKAMLAAQGINSHDADHIDSFSFRKFIVNQVRGGGQEGVEKEMLQEGYADVKNLGSESRGFHVPAKVLAVIRANKFRNDLTAGGSGTGAELLFREPLQALVEPFYEAMMTRQLGATFLSGLVGNVPFPVGTRDTTKPAWKTEIAASTEITPTTSVITLSPKRLPAFVELSMQFLLQTSPAIEAFVRDNLLQEIGVVWEKGILHGSGSSGQPTGLAATAGIGSVAGGTNGLAPAWAHIVGLETALADANVNGTFAYLTNSVVRGKLKTTSLVASTDSEFVWDRKTPEAPLNGYRAEVSNCVSRTLTKGTSSGVASAIFFGRWSDLVIGQWGGLDILANPYSRDTEGMVRINAAAFGDSAAIRPASFAAMLDALTA